jgi:LmbE family N-acetylglucosaminyl deacetylase
MKGYPKTVMKIILRKVKSLLSFFIMNIVWVIQANNIRLKAKIKKISTFKEKSSEIFILIPHADDEWIGCSRILKKYHKKVHACFADLTGFNNEELNRQIRKEELNTLLKKYGVNSIDISSNIEEKLLNNIDKFRPKYIFVPYNIDWHDEHHLIINILNKALKKLNSNNKIYINEVKICMYQVSVPIPQENITHAIGLSFLELINKWYIFKKIYKSQKNLPSLRFALNEYINGSLNHSFAAEVYSIHHFIDWSEYIDKINLQKGQKQEIIDNINDLLEIRKITNKLLNAAIHNN